MPAYRNVLKNHGIDPAKIKTLDDFKTLPVINKKNYIYEHSLTDVFPDKNYSADGLRQLRLIGQADFLVPRRRARGDGRNCMK